MKVIVEYFDRPSKEYKHVKEVKVGDYAEIYKDGEKQIIEDDSIFIIFRKTFIPISRNQIKRMCIK